MLKLIDINYIKLTFGLMTVFIIINGILINLFEKYLPNSMKQSFRFGKMSFKGANSRLISMLEVPKSYFQHFYMYSSVLMSWLLGIAISVYVFQVVVPKSVFDILDRIGGMNRIARVSSLNVFLALLLLTIQCVKRVYDSNFVSVFSKSSKMNLSHYACGFIHYTGVAIAIFLEAPSFAKQELDIPIYLGYLDLLSIFVFLVACYQQLKVTTILANLRKNSKGEVISDKHSMPEGGLFTYLSSPHMSCEIVMYMCLTYILRGNESWLYIFAWVLSNQIEVILLNHWWYQKTFKKFPPNRKALIPFIY